MARVVISHEAQRDLAEIWKYLGRESSKSRADAVLRAIMAKLDTVAEQPGVGRARDELRPGLRSFPVGRYLIFYEQLPDGIAVVRVLHGRRDLDALFEEDGDPEDSEQ